MTQKKHLLEPGWVYVVDDSAPALKYAEWHLRRLGWRVFAFPDARACVQALGSHAPEAMLLDIGLPDGSGYVIATRLRRNTATRRMRIVAYTGMVAEERQVLPEAGFDAVIAKPGRAEDFARHLPTPQDGDSLVRLASWKSAAAATSPGSALLRHCA
ncbi:MULTISPECIES: response regulator [Ramlibacter]|uniref:Response regulator n=1 Tax=Ramlibacter aquaticus TaxID=2780094 RepID=A0ABR9SKC4_9BURK|nr:MULTISPECIES: response regulator [Ramlibacter]MBE7942808.1 response regulator [Ramlibacter aquaticus]